MLEGSLVVDQHPMYWREIVLVPLSIKTRNKLSEDFTVLFTYSEFQNQRINFCAQ